MKRHPLLLALALMFVVSAFVWGVNYRLSHPPLSPADVEFRALIARADSVEIIQSNNGGPAEPDRSLVMEPLNSASGAALKDCLRLVRGSIDIFPQGPHQVHLKLRFLANGQLLREFSLMQNRKASQLSSLAFKEGSYKVHPRFEKPLRRALDELAPQRLQP